MCSWGGDKGLETAAGAGLHSVTRLVPRTVHLGRAAMVTLCTLYSNFKEDMQTGKPV